jgi:acyl dehydratase
MKNRLLRQNQVYFEDIVVGTTIPTLEKGPYSPMDTARFASMYGDFYPGHFDSKWAIEIDHIPKAIVHGYHLVTHMTQLLTDWISPDGFINMIKTQVRAQAFVGEKVSYKGKVEKRIAGKSEGRVECSVWGEKPDGIIVIQGKAIVSLPFQQSR